MDDLDQRLGALRAHLDEVVVNNFDDVLRRRRRHLVRRGLTGGLAAVVAAGVAVALFLPGSHRGSDSTLITSPSPSITAKPTPNVSPTEQPPPPANPAAAGRLLGITPKQTLVLQRTFADGRDPEQLPLDPLPGTDPVVRSLTPMPGGGWIVGYSPGSGSDAVARVTYFAQVQADGTVSSWGEPVNSFVGAIAVSPDGQWFALVAADASGIGAAAIEVRATPGHSGTTRQWTLARDEGNTIKSLSWAPDSRHLTYIWGDNTGAGIGGDPALLDIDAPGNGVPTAAAWSTNKNQCVWDVVTYTPAGDVAVAGECADDGDFIRLQPVDPQTGELGSQAVEVPGRGCLDTEITAVSGNSERLVIVNCGKTYVVAGGQSVRLPVTLEAASF